MISELRFASQYIPCTSNNQFGPFVEVYSFLLDLIGRLNNNGVASRIKCPFKLTELLTPKLKWNQTYTYTSGLLKSQVKTRAFGPFCLNLWIKWIEITLKFNTSVTGLTVLYIEFIGLNILAVASFQLQSPSEVILRNTDVIGLM